MKVVLKSIILIIMVIFISGCGKKEIIKNSEFSAILTKEGFSVTDVTNFMEDYSVKSVYAANNGSYQIEYYIFENEKVASEAYKNNKKTFDSGKKIKGKEKTGDGYQKYTQELSDQYNNLTRVKNTLIYASVNIEHKSNLKKMIKKLGY